MDRDCHDTLPAMLWDFTAMGAFRSTLKSIVDAAIARHRDSRDGHLPSLVTGPAAYSRLTRCLGSLLCTPGQQPHKLGVTRHMVVALLRYRPRQWYH